MSEVLKMNNKAREIKGLFEMVKQGRLTIRQASEQSGLSYRQARRVYQAYKQHGDAGLIHKSRDQQSNRKHPHRADIVALYREKYEGFGPTLAAEYLLKTGYIVDHDSLRRWLIAEGLWARQRKRKTHHPRRERRAQFGELLQIDGSIHDWFSEGKHSCLLNIVDDATGKTLAMLDSGETTAIIFKVLWKWIECYGIPLAVYVDLKSAYISPKEGQMSYFQKACSKLGIEVIKAYSPQAKGRVERNHRVYQDRFVKALKLAGINSIAEGNTFLEQHFLPELNNRFERQPRNPSSAHRTVENCDLNQILCWENERKIQHDWTFSFENQAYKVNKKRGEAIAPKSQVYVRKHLDGTMSVWHRENLIDISPMTKEELFKQRTQNIDATKSSNNIKKSHKRHGSLPALLFQPRQSIAQREQEIRTGHSIPYGH